MLHQPYHVFSVYYVYIGFGFQCSQSLFLGSQHPDHPQTVQMVPLFRFSGPGILRNLQRSDYQDLVDSELILEIFPQQGHRDDGLSKPHAQKQSGVIA